MYSPRTGGRYNGVRPSPKAVAAIKGAIRQRLRPGNQAPWVDVVHALNRTVRGWLAYFSYGTVTNARRAVQWYLYHRVRCFLRRRHKLAGSGLSAVPHAGRVRGTGCLVATLARGLAAAHAVM